MSPKDWGPSVWMFLHSLVAGISDEGYLILKTELYHLVHRILVLLPCPECSEESVAFFRQVSIHKLPTKINFVHTLYLLHNRVNAKLKKPLFNSEKLGMYTNVNIIVAYNNFVRAFSTTTARLMNDNLHRRLFITQLSKWIKTHINYFIQYKGPPINKASDTSIHNIKSELDTDVPLNIKSELDTDVPLNIKSEPDTDVLLEVKSEPDTDVPVEVKSEPDTDVPLEVKSELDTTDLVIDSEIVNSSVPFVVDTLPSEQIMDNLFISDNTPLVPCIESIPIVPVVKKRGRRKQTV